MFSLHEALTLIFPSLHNTPKRNSVYLGVSCKQKKQINNIITMKDIKKILIQLFLKLIIGAAIFLIMGRIINPEKPIFNEGICSAFIGLAIFFIGESIWKAYQQQKKLQK